MYMDQLDLFEPEDKPADKSSDENSDERLKESLLHQISVLAWDCDVSQVKNLGMDLSLKSSNIDSLDAVEMIMAMEDHFCMEIPDEDADLWKTVEDVVNYVFKWKYGREA